MRIVLIMFIAAVTVLAANYFWSASIVAEVQQPIEIGTVRWNRDFDAALVVAKNKQKPVFALFQEVPGCDGCKSFGEVVLSHPLIVDAIETEFVPVVIYNNQGGTDAELLKRYQEPSWNFQVIRFLDPAGVDIIPPKDKVWSVAAVVGRMEEALQKFAKRPLPEYLRGLLVDETSASVGQALFAQHCFWTGEAQLGAIPGVLKTEAGFYAGSEVTRVWYDKSLLTFATLQRRAVQLGVADASYCSKSEAVGSDGATAFESFDPARYRKAPASDQKRQIQGTPFAKLELNEYQASKVNAFARQDSEQALNYLSPSQIQELQAR